MPEVATGHAVSRNTPKLAEGLELVDWLRLDLNP